MKIQYFSSSFILFILRGKCISMNMNYFTIGYITLWMKTAIMHDINPLKRVVSLNQYEVHSTTNSNSDDINGGTIDFDRQRSDSVDLQGYMPSTSKYDNGSKQDMYQNNKKMSHFSSYKVSRDRSNFPISANPMQKSLNITTHNSDYLINQKSRTYANFGIENNTPFQYDAKFADHERILRLKMRYLDNLLKSRDVPGFIVKEIDFLNKELESLDIESFKNKLRGFLERKSQQSRRIYKNIFLIFETEILLKFDYKFYDAIVFLIFYDFFSLNFRRIKVSKDKDLYLGIHNNEINTSDLILYPFRLLLANWKVSEKYEFGYEMYDKLIELFIEEHKKLPHNVITTGKRFVAFKYVIISDLCLFLMRH
ncbi:hypothetical protein H312_00521 [Anncaliia algerae PRA339]|uniref:Uncharacterized protein n=1 Tax=Anncaliia algerae PRA339 TaxID=1288291 RepID=A0A059F4Z4_9MICR|nr:hypothetical protein H312_00521 [Anncaliia algerae PRA339]